MDIHGQKLVVVGKILGNEREIHVVSQRITDGEPPIRAFQAGHVHSGGGEGKPLCGGIGNHAHAVPLVHDAHDVRRGGRIVKIKDFEDVVEVEQAFFIVPHHLALRHEAFLSDVEKMVRAYGNLEESPAVEKFFQRLVIGELSPQVVSFDVACPGSACHEFVAALYACHDLVVESLDCSVMQESGGDVVVLVGGNDQLAKRSLVVIIRATERVASRAFNVVEVEERVAVEQIIGVPHESLSPVDALPPEFQAPFVLLERDGQAVERDVEYCVIVVHQIPGQVRDAVVLGVSVPVEGIFEEGSEEHPVAHTGVDVPVFPRLPVEIEPVVDCVLPMPVVRHILCDSGNHVAYIPPNLWFVVALGCRLMGQRAAK